MDIRAIKPVEFKLTPKMARMADDLEEMAAAIRAGKILAVCCVSVEAGPDREVHTRISYEGGAFILNGGLNWAQHQLNLQIDAD